MKVIDLLNIPLDKLPKKIKYEYLEYELLPERNDYYCSKEMRWFTNEINALGVLNDEVEILEEDKKIEKIDLKIFEETPYFASNDEIIAMKINEIIDYLQSKGE